MSRCETRRDLALASLTLALDSIPKWSATRRTLEARVRWLKATETLTADQLADEAYRLLDVVLRWKQLDQTARVQLDA